MQSVQTRAGIEVEFALAGSKSNAPHNFIVLERTQHKHSSEGSQKHTLVIEDNNLCEGYLKKGKTPSAVFLKLGCVYPNLGYFDRNNCKIISLKEDE